MLKKYLTSSIIVLIQFIVLAAIAATITPLLFQNSNSLKQVNTYFILYQTTFLLGHSLFYMLFYLSWPTLVKRIAADRSIKPEHHQIDKAIQIRNYLIAIFASIELINLLR